MPVSQKYALAIFNILFLIVAITAGINLIGQDTDTQGQAAQFIDTVFLDTDTVSPVVSQRFAVEAKTSTTTHRITHATISISFDHTQLKLLDIQPGTVITDKSAFDFSFDNNSGTATYSLESTDPILAAGSIATFVFEPISTGTTTLTIDNQSKLSLSPDTANLFTINPSLAIPIRP